MISELTNQIQKVFEVQARILDIHPLLSETFPIAVVEKDQFFIFDTDTSKKQYGLIKQAEAPMAFPPKIRAAFPLACYDNKIACVVTKDVFDSDSGYVTIFHEFIHCQQSAICEQKIKSTLQIAQSNQDPMWELNHPFPYDEPDFITCYNAFLTLAKAGSPLRDVLAQRKQFKHILNHEDYEYMIWQEWKEGFARFIENRIKHKLKMPENHGGTTLPFSRVLFYEGGALFIKCLSTQTPNLMIDIENLYKKMFL